MAIRAAAIGEAWRATPTDFHSVLRTGKAGCNMWKFTRDEKRWQNPGFHQNPNFQRAELFLDFDPVAPEWPREQSTEPRLEEESAPPAGIVVTTEDFRRLKLMIRAVRGR